MFEGGSFLAAIPDWPLQRPGKVIFAERDLEPALGGKQIHGQAAFPKRNHQRKRIAPAHAQQLACNRNLEDAIARSDDHVLRPHQTRIFRLHMLIAKFSLPHLQDEAQFLIAAQRDAKLGVLQRGQSSLGEIHANIESLAAEAVTKLPQPIDAAVHGTFLPVGRIESRAHPFEISGLAPIDAHIEKRRRRDHVRRRRFALDGLGQLVGSVAA